MIDQDIKDRIREMTKEQILKNKGFVQFVLDEKWNPFYMSVETLRSFYIEYLS
jgi:hypothetical protein